MRSWFVTTYLSDPATSNSWHIILIRSWSILLFSIYTKRADRSLSLYLPLAHRNKASLGFLPIVKNCCNSEIFVSAAVVSFHYLTPQIAAYQAMGSCGLPFLIHCQNLLQQVCIRFIHEICSPLINKKVPKCPKSEYACQAMVLTHR